MHEILQKLGFSEKEASVYLAALEFGTAPASAIARKAKVNRLTTYSTLQSLIQKGYISQQKRGNIMLFSAVHPRIILNQAEQNFQEIQEQYPQFLSIFNLYGNRPKISFYEGVEGIHSLWNMTLSCTEKKMFQISHSKTMVSMAGKEFLLNYVQQRAKNNIVNYCVDDFEGRENFDIDYPVGSNTELLRESRIAPKDFHTSGITIIYDNNVLFMASKKESFGFAIESEEYSTLMKSLFHTLWQVSQEDKKV